MSKRDKLLQKARNAPQDLGFEELCALEEFMGLSLRDKPARIGYTNTRPAES